MDRLTKRERQILEVFWRTNQPLSIADVIEQDPDLNKNTVAAVVKKLFVNNLLEIGGIGYNKTALTRQYLPTISEEQFIAQEMSQDSLSKLVTNFIDTTKDMESLNELEKQILERKKLIKKDRN
ncbi:BlaI/MecI/CopY family transcriptional regulator [Enterococcus sp. HY326]|uniref:BlaI/MecI/CopY family transcriptional regulator n=1 Tax=Enterococcus sp. HY326 TaxID=2971265 RepID=UPI00224092E7|nr:BlaI/MecI/CopY family transcriptional regulator [Enterococcus sp. HY326]